MPGYTSVNTPSQWLTISWAKRANIHSQPCAKILKLCFRNFPKVRTADEGHARTQRCLRRKGLGAAHPRARKALSLPARLRPRLRSGTCLRPRTAVGTLPCRLSHPRAVPASSGCARPFHGQHRSARESHLAVLMPLLVCSPSPSCFLKPTPFPTGCRQQGGNRGAGRAVPQPGWLSTYSLGSAIKAPVEDEAAIEQHFPEILPRTDSPEGMAGAGQAVMTGLGDYCRRQKPEGETGFPGATPAGINTHAGQAALPGDEIAACWRHCLSARGYQSRKGTKETAGVNGPNLLLLQPLITRGAAGQTGRLSSATRS